MDHFLVQNIVLNKSFGITVENRFTDDKETGKTGFLRFFTQKNVLLNQQKFGWFNKVFRLNMGQ